MRKVSAPPESEKEQPSEEELRQETAAIRANIEALRAAQAPLVTAEDIETLAGKLRLAYLHAERNDALLDRQAEIERAKNTLEVLELENNIKEAILRGAKDKAQEFLSELEKIDKDRAEKLREKLRI